MTGRRALVCAPVPQYDRDSGSRRLLDLVTFLREAGWDVTFVADEWNYEPRYARALQQRGIPVYTGSRRWIESLFEYGTFEVALFGLWHIAEPHIPAIRRISPDTRILVDSVDLHFLRFARQLFLDRRTRGTYEGLDGAYASEMVRELNTYAGVDGVLAVSRKEAGVINDMIGDPDLATPLALCEDESPSVLPFAERRGILFVGYFPHQPNVAAVEFLCTDVLPRIEPAVLQEHPVFIVGGGMDGQVMALCRRLPQVRTVGWVPSLSPYLSQARVSVVPILFGAGTRGKLIQSLMAGTPSVTTTVGMEGLDLRDGEHVLVADDPDAFARAIVKLVSEEALWEKLRRQGQEHVRSIHSRDAVRTSWLQAIDRVVDRPAKRLSSARAGPPSG